MLAGCRQGKLGEAYVVEADVVELLGVGFGDTEDCCEEAGLPKLAIVGGLTWEGDGA